MKNNLFQVILILICGTAFGQNLPNLKESSYPSNVEWCSQQEKMNEMRLNHPELYANIARRSTKPYQEHYAPAVQEKVTGVVYTIPVVFHIIHNNGVEDIDDAQIQDQLNILNRDFRKLNADANSVVAAFQGMPSDVEVEFKFATVAPNGACFDGITRTVSSSTSSSNGQAQVNAVVAGNNVFPGVWPHNRYLNIYVCRNIGGAAGYTFLPATNSTANATNMYYNGIFMLHDYVGSIGTSSTGTSRALTHEVGHWLNLYHIWGTDIYGPGDANGCSDDDGIQDTPNARGSQSCNLTSNTCTSDNAYWGFNQIDNVENYMDYSFCSKMFTQGQVDEMRAALASSTGGRSNIWTTANLQLVGAIPGSSLCSIDFEANETVICAGTTVTYTPNTTTGISNYAWSFPNGVPTTSNLQNPTVTYSTPGTHNATLVVTSSANGSTYTEAKTTYITVNGGTTVNLPISEPFTNAGTPAGWTIVNLNGGTTWTRIGTVGNPGGSFVFDNANVDDRGNTDEFRTANFSTVGMSSSQLTFDVAYAPYDATWYDGLEVLVSSDCGATYTSVYSKIGAALQTRTATTNLFTPTAAQWRNETIDLSPFIGESSVQVAFRNLAGYGNRLFVDNINITGVTSAPTADFNASSSTACTSETVTFTDASVGATSWNWDFGVGATPPNATGAGPHDVTYASGGTKTVSLTINGGSNTTENVTVTAPPSAPTINAGGPTTFCAGGNVVLTSSSATGNLWSTGATTQSITVTTAGNYTVTASSGTCASSPSSTTSVTVNPVPSTPTINASGSTSLCSGGSVVLTSSSATGNVWSTGATTQSITVTAGNTYTVSVNNGTCLSNPSSGVTVTVTTTPSVPVINASGPTTFCAGGSVVLTSSSTSGNLWSTGATTQSITVSTAGNYTVTASSGTCVSSPSSTTAVTVNPLPSTPTINASGPTSFCTGGSVVLTSSSATGNVWSTGATTQSITVTTGNTYTVSVNNGTCVSNPSSGVIVSVTTTPSTPVINASGPTTFCAGGSVVLSSSSPSLNTWSNGATTQSITVTAGNTYTVTAGNVGCSATSNATTVTVNPLPTVTFGALSQLCVYNSPITLTQGSPAGGTYSGAGVSGGMFNPTTAGTGTKVLTYSYTDGNGCSNSATSNIVVDGCLSIDEENGNSMSIYPNPSNGMITLNSEGYILNSVSVYNQIGQLVYNRTSDQIEKDINLMNFESGVYTIRVNHESGIENIRVILSK